ncbi:hypothetical protein RSAG8_10803, partial [Rhizoctonia solani AG-8 WAC10335]
MAVKTQPEPSTAPDAGLQHYHDSHELVPAPPHVSSPPNDRAIGS